MANITKNKENFIGCEGEHILQEKFATKEKAESFYKREMYEYLTPTMRDFIQKQNMFFLSTADKDGECDCSLRSGTVGFVYIVDEKHLAYPEYQGNGVVASLGNMYENPQAGMLFVDFTNTQTGLHVNGKATILSSEALQKVVPKEEKENFISHTKTLNQKEFIWVLIKVQEAYIHCSKNIQKMTAIAS